MQLACCGEFESYSRSAPNRNAVDTPKGFGCAAAGPCASCPIGGQRCCKVGSPTSGCAEFEGCVGWHCCIGGNSVIKQGHEEKMRIARDKHRTHQAIMHGKLPSDAATQAEVERNEADLQIEAKRQSAPWSLEMEDHKIQTRLRKFFRSN